MQKYIEAFLEEFDYPLDSREVLTAAYDVISKSEEASDLFNRALSEYKKNVNCDCQFDVSTRVECSIDVLSAFCECDSDNVYPTVNISCDLTFIAPKKVKAVASSITGEAALTSSSSVITVYYPEREDTLFDVAKKFHTSSVKVAVDNSLTENVVAGADTSLILSGVDFLIIKP